MYKQHGIRLCGDAADIGEADVAGDPFGAEFVEIAGEDAHADRDLLIRRKKLSGVRHGGTECRTADPLTLCNQHFAVYHIFVSAAG